MCDLVTQCIIYVVPSFSLSFDIFQAHKPSLRYMLLATTSPAGTIMTRKMFGQQMQNLMNTTSLTTLSGLTLSTRMASATSPGIHTNFHHQRKCCRASRTKSARYQKTKITPLADFNIYSVMFSDRLSGFPILVNTTFQ